MKKKEKQFSRKEYLKQLGLSPDRKKPFVLMDCPGFRANLQQIELLYNDIMSFISGSTQSGV